MKGTSISTMMFIGIIIIIRYNYNNYTLIVIHYYFFRYSLGYVYGSLLEKDLHSFVSEWNDHPIRRNSQASSPHGRPNDIII